MFFLLNQATCFTDWNLEANRCPADNSGLWLHASDHTARELRAIAQTRLLSGFALDIPERAQMVPGPHQGGKDQHATLNIIIKDLLSAHCVQSPVLSSWGISKKSLSCDLRCRMAFITEESKTQSNLTLINNETTYQNRGTQKWKAMASRERSSVVGTSRSAMRSLNISGWYLTEVTVPGTWS